VIDPRDSETRRPPRIFVSYARADSALVDQIVGALEDAGLAVWIDRREVQPGDSFLAKINDALAVTDYVLLVMTRAAIESKWVEREWMSSLASKTTTVLPLRAEACELPPLLRDIVFVDLVGRVEDGLSDLVGFLLREEQKLALKVRMRAPDRPLVNSPPRTIRQVALHCMNEGYLQQFLFDANIPGGTLAGGSLHERIVSLLVKVSNDELLAKFALWMELEPDLSNCIRGQLRKLESAPTWDFRPD